MIPFIQHLKKANLEQKRTDQDSQELARKEDLTKKEKVHKGDFWGDRTIQYLIRGGKQVYLSKS